MLSTAGARLRHRLQAFVDIRPGEGARVALLFLYSVAAVGGVLTVGLAASDTLFVSELPPSALPSMFILPAASIIPALLLYNRVAARLRLDQAIIVSNMLLASSIRYRSASTRQWQTCKTCDSSKAIAKTTTL